MQVTTEKSSRIKRIRERYQTETPWISVQRARFYTESWRETVKSGLSAGVRVALAMKNVFENMDIHVDAGDRIAGAWTENYVGIPIDIERGLFNNVLQVEFDRMSMMVHQAGAGLRYAGFALKNYKPHGLADIVSTVIKMDTPPPSIGNDTIDRRKVNPYRIKADDKRILLDKLLPYWKGKTIADIVRKEVSESGLYTKEFKMFVDALPTTNSRDATLVSPGSAIGTWQGHLVLDHSKVIRKGLAAMLEGVKTKAADGCDTEEADFLKSIEIAIEGVIAYARRLCEKIEAMMVDECDEETLNALSSLHEVCRRVPLYPARTFAEAVQSYWTVKNAVELSMPFNVHAPGRLDQMFYPYYKRDIEEDRLSPDDARDILEELFLKIMSHNMRPNSGFTSDFNQRYEGSEPVTLGGLDRDGNDATNELTYVMLDAAEESRASLNFVLRLHKDSPEELFLKVAEIYHRGVSSVSMMNDEISIKAMKKRGFKLRDARDYAITGCVDMVAPGKTGGEGFSSILLCRILDMALRNGDAKTIGGTVHCAGLKTGKPDSFDCFEVFLDAYYTQLDNEISRVMDAARIRDSIFARILPAPFISAFMGGCLERCKDVTRGGADYDLEGLLVMSSVANATDSLYVIKKLVFEERKFTLKELVRAIDDNFKGHEKILDEILNLKGKWGNGNPESDTIARQLTDHIFKQTYKYTSFKGGMSAPFINSMTAHTIDGRVSLATPDGRRAGRPFAASCNPYNVEKNGTTGVLRSVAALDFSHVLGCAVNIRLHPSAIGSTEMTRKKWMSLIKTYFMLGGEQLQPTVVSTKLLRLAQADPEQYRDIIVKVGGYSAYFTELGVEIQNEIISRSEHN